MTSSNGSSRQLPNQNQDATTATGSGQNATATPKRKTHWSNRKPIGSEPFKPSTVKWLLDKHPHGTSRGQKKFLEMALVYHGLPIDSYQNDCVMRHAENWESYAQEIGYDEALKEYREGNE